MTAAQAKKRRIRGTIIDNSAIIILLLLASLTHGGVFGDYSGYIAAIGGVAVGGMCAFVASRLKLGIFSSALTLVAGYLLVGGPIAVPQTVTYGVLPTRQTMNLLVTGAVSSWKELLTVQPPASEFAGTAVMPYVSATFAAFVALTIVLRTRRGLYALLPIFIFAVVGILWGSQNAPLALGSGIAASIIASAWAGDYSARSRQSGLKSSVEFSSSLTQSSKRRRIHGTLMVLSAAVVSFLVTPMLVNDGERLLLRDHIVPPLDIREYHSPIAAFRSWNTTEANATLFTVTGLKEDERIRLATLNLYDGTVFKINGADNSADFRRVGEHFTDSPLSEGQRTDDLEIQIGEYRGYWLPGGGETRSLEYLSERGPSLKDALYYSQPLQTIISTEPLAAGDAYRLVNVTQRGWTDAELKDKAIIQATAFPDSYVPSAVAESATSITEDVSGGVETVRAIQQHLHDEGFYSDGVDGLSIPGHRSDRLERFLSATQMVGDDDQYAPAMALMLRSLGIPSRVVLGFYPEQYDQKSYDITGKEAHVWVEVPFEGAGWVAFDPTPPKDQRPQTQVPKPRPNPNPQVLQPPEPPEDPAEAPAEVIDDPEGDEEEKGNGWGEIFILVAKIAGGIFILLLPLLLIFLIKAVRTYRRRRKKQADEKAAAAWDEVLDNAIDLGAIISPRKSRPRQAEHIDAYLDSEVRVSETSHMAFVPFNAERKPLVAFADELDSVVFGVNAPKGENSEEIWARSAEVMSGMRKRVPWYRRLRATFSTRSIRKRLRNHRDLNLQFSHAKGSRYDTVNSTDTDEVKQ
ncbi:MAG: hypothetical protein CSA82_03895 [Actinobacteria bacterium]|nr:MAG: hypothetical protein CSA82_03895 [Actinomycetota bacterium]